MSFFVKSIRGRTRRSSHAPLLTGSSAKYLNDFYFLTGLDGAAPKWKKTEQAPGDERPAPRSGCCLAPHDDVLFLFGGYSAAHGPWNDLWAYYHSSGLPGVG